MPRPAWLGAAAVTAAGVFLAGSWVSGDGAAAPGVNAPTPQPSPSVSWTGDVVLDAPPADPPPPEDASVPGAVPSSPDEPGAGVSDAGSGVGTPGAPAPTETSTGGQASGPE